MRSGNLRHRVIIQKPSGTRDAVGEVDTEYCDIATEWAAITPLNSRDIIASAQSHLQVTHEVIVRYRAVLSDIDVGWRVNHNGRYLYVAGVYNIRERDKSYRLLCHEGLRD